MKTSITIQQQLDKASCELAENYKINRIVLYLLLPKSFAASFPKSEDYKKYYNRHTFLIPQFAVYLRENLNISGLNKNVMNYFTQFYMKLITNCKNYC